MTPPNRGKRVRYRKESNDAYCVYVDKVRHAFKGSHEAKAFFREAKRRLER